jgi:hypothetical protein
VPSNLGTPRYGRGSSSTFAATAAGHIRVPLYSMIQFSIIQFMLSRDGTRLGT